MAISICFALGFNVVHNPLSIMPWWDFWEGLWKREGCIEPQWRPVELWKDHKNFMFLSPSVVGSKSRGVTTTADPFCWLEG